MDGLVLVKISELSDVLREVKTIRQKIEHLQSEEDMRTYTVQQVAEMLNFSYNTVRKLIRERKLFPKYADEKKKKGVDTRASKGRRIRFNVMDKIVNFMAPEPRSQRHTKSLGMLCEDGDDFEQVEWHDEKIDELFQSLFRS